MPTLYKYICYSCRDNNITISDEDEAEGYGIILQFKEMERRDDEYLCPSCNGLLVRDLIPDNFTVWWGNPYNKKKIPLGPSVDYYPPTRDKKRKEAIPTRHIDMSPRGIERSTELKQDAQKAPKVTELPKPGVT